MCENRNSKDDPRRPWPEKYPKWLIEVLEYSMEETGMSRRIWGRSTHFRISPLERIKVFRWVPPNQGVTESTLVNSKFFLFLTICQ